MLDTGQKETIMIRCIAVDYGSTLTTGDVDPSLGMRRVDPCATVALRTLHTHGLTLLLASNTISGRDRRAALHQAGILDLFSCVLQSHELTEVYGFPIEKPHSGFYRVIFRATGTRPDEVLFVGNHLIKDVQEPLHFGMKAALVRPDGLQNGEILPEGALLIQHIADLPLILGLVREVP